MSARQVSAKAGERRLVTALVADVAGSTAIGETLGPERSKFLFDDVARLMSAEIERYGGTVAQLTGDGVLALFGVPLAHDADAERAVRAALAIHEALARYAAEVAPGYGIDLRSRIAINTGPVVVPAGAAPVDVLYNALGDTVNVAARLQALGDVVVGETTARQIRDVFELEDLGAVELKGKSQPVLAYRVLGLRSGPPSRPRTPLVGRTRDLAVLTDALERLGEGSGVIVSITGEPGIGKSRLVAEAENVSAGRVRFLAGNATSYTASIPYWPIRELMRAWLGLGASDSETRARIELRSGLARTMADEGAEAYPFLAALLGLTLEAGQQERMRDLAPDAVRNETHHWLYRLVSVIAEEEPLCVVLEDLQWSDEATRVLLDHLLPVVETHAVAFVFVHRNDPTHPAWQLVDRARRRFGRRFVELDLQPLDDTEALQLANADMGAALPETLARRLVERVGGNPYFVQETLQDLRERGALAVEDGRVVLVGDVALPAALQEAAQARIDRLDGDARELITTAAVIGRTFSLPLLESLLPGTRLGPALSELRWLQVLVEDGSSTAPEYRFRHGLLQEVAYGGILEDRRQELHLRVGEALAEIYRDSADEAHGLLAYHFSEANEPERAIEHLLRAGDAARAIFAQDEATLFYGRALDFMERTADDVRTRETWFKIGLTHHLAFDFHAANEAFAEGFARPAPPRVRLEPTETATWCLPAAWDGALTPGHAYSGPASLVSRNLFAGLLAMGPGLVLEPGVAERFSVADDGRTYIFTLRSDALWSDGTPVTAGDFAFAFAAMVEEGVASAFWLDDVSATAVDERTLEVRLREARNEFPYVLTQPPFFPWPRHVHERLGRDWHRQTPLVGNGPFILSGRDPSHRLDASPTWHGSRGNVAQVIVELRGSPETTVEQWADGAFDVIDKTLYLRPIVDADTIVERSPGMTTAYLGFNAQRAPFDDVRIRRAVAHAVDTRALGASIGQTGSAGGGMLPPTMPGHSQRVAPSYDPDQAGTILAAAGFADPSLLGELTIAHIDLSADFASHIAADLARIGIRTRLVDAGSDLGLERLILEGADTFVWGWGADYPDPGRGFLESFTVSQPTLYREQRIDDLLTHARSMRDQDERLRAYREFERSWIGEAVAVVPLVYADDLLIRRPWVSGMWIGPTEISTFADAVVQRPG